MTTCTRFACFLSGKESLISFPLVTVAGLVDGINPCSIAMLVFLLGYLIVILEKRERALPIAITFISSVFFTYLILGLFLYETISKISIFSLRREVNLFSSVILALFGLINIKDYFWPGIGPHLKIPSFIQPKLREIGKAESVLSTVVFAALVTVFEAPCSLPLYAGTARILFYSGLPKPGIILYFLYYNLLFILPLIAVATAFLKGVNFLKIEDLTHGTQPKMKIISGLTLILFALLIYFW